MKMNMNFPLHRIERSQEAKDLPEIIIIMFLSLSFFSFGRHRECIQVLGFNSWGYRWEQGRSILRLRPQVVVLGVLQKTAVSDASAEAPKREFLKGAYCYAFEIYSNS